MSASWIAPPEYALDDTNELEREASQVETELAAVNDAIDALPMVPSQACTRAAVLVLRVAADQLSKTLAAIFQEYRASKEAQS